MRRLALLLIVGSGCGVLQERQQPKQLEFPTFAPGDTYHTRVADLRTALGRAGIGLRMAGVEATFASEDCDHPEDGRRDFGGCVRCDLIGEQTGVDGSVLEAATRAFVRYPTEVLVATKIDHVAACRDIVYARAGQPEHPAGTVDFRGHGMLIGLSYFLERTPGAYETFSVDDIVHHELYHLLEHEHMRDAMDADPEWTVQNPTGFAYSELAAKTGTRRDGFVNAYAMTNAVEDRASVYQFLMARSEELCDLARTDEIVRVKARIIWRRVARAAGTDRFLRDRIGCTAALGV